MDEGRRQPVSRCGSGSGLQRGDAKAERCRVRPVGPSQGGYRHLGAPVGCTICVVGMAYPMSDSKSSPVGDAPRLCGAASDPHQGSREFDLAAVRRRGAAITADRRGL